MLKFLALFFLSLNLFLTCADAMEKERLHEFFKEYDVSQEKKEWRWDRVSFAIEKGYVDVAEFFILRGDAILNYSEPFTITWKADDKREYEYLKHPLMTAIRKNYTNLAILLIQSHKSLTKAIEFKRVNPPNHNFGTTYDCLEKKDPMHVAIAECKNNKEIIEALILAGFEVDKAHNFYTFPYKYGEFTLTKPITYLQLAIQLKKIDIARLFLEYNAGVEFEGLSGTTPLLLAVVDNYFDGASLLLCYGADPVKFSHFAGVRLSPLEYAMQKGYCDIVDLLLSAAVN